MTHYRIAMVGACPYPVPQGSQVFLHNTAAALREIGHDVRLVVYGYGEGYACDDIALHRCLKIPFVRRTTAGPSFWKPILDTALACTLRRLVARHRIDIVHAHNYEGLLVALMAGHRPIVYHAHNALADELPYYFKGRTWARSVGGSLDRVLPKRADRVIAFHDRLANYLNLSGCPADRITVIPPSIEVDAFQPCSVNEALPPVLYTGNLDEYQNLAFLERVMTAVRTTLPETACIIATNVPERVPDWATAVDVRHFEELRALLSRDAVMVCPRTSWSGYPIKLLNGMTSGQAMVVCASAAHGLEHGVNALVVPDDDENAFTEAVCTLMKSSGQRRRLGEQARITALDRHSPLTIAKALTAVYDGLASRTKTP